VAGFVTMCDVWIATIFMSGLKFYKTIVFLFGGGYGISVVLAVALRGQGLEGLLAGYIVGQFLMLMGMVFIILRSFPAERLIAFDCFRPGAMYPTLMGVGLLFNFAIWADKIVFWIAADTGRAVIGPLRASVIYDMPVFLAYLGIIPGMAVFLVRFETDFVEWYDKFYNAVREGGSLEEIARMRDEMVFAIRQGLFDIIKIQTLSVLVLVVFAPTLFEKLNISKLYLPLFYVDAVAASLQVALLAIMNVFFYLDKRREVLATVALLSVLNVLLSMVSLRLGVVFYGYGFALAILVTLAFALAVLERKLGRLEYETFMLQ
jgi:polysaccharide biosynthesis protein PelG